MIYDGNVVMSCGVGVFFDFKMVKEFLIYSINCCLIKFERFDLCVIGDLMKMFGDLIENSV